jgi:hypothetical protein
MSDDKYYETSIEDRPEGEGWEYNGQGVWLREIKKEDVDPGKLLTFKIDYFEKEI